MQKQKLQSIRRSSSQNTIQPQIELIHFERNSSLTQSTFFKTFTEMPQMAVFTNQVSRIPSPKQRLIIQLSHNKQQRESIINQSRERQENAMSEALSLTQKTRFRNYQKLKRRDQSPKKAVELQPHQKVFQLPKLDVPLEEQINTPQQLTFYIEAQKIIRDVRTFKPSFTEQAALTLFNDQLYLYGGIGGDGVRNQMLKYDIKFQIWQVVQTNGDIPKQGRAGLSVIQYKNKFIYFGGCGQFNPKMKIRECTNSIFEYNVSTNTWEKILPQGDYIEPRRQHRACLIGSKWMLIYGGINSNEEVLSDTCIFNIEKQIWKHYKVKSPQISSHGLVNISFQGKFVENITNNDIMPLDQIYSFGGKDIDGNSINTLRKLIFCQSNNTPLSWDIVETTGKSPYPMHNHTIEYLKKVQGIVVIGGLRDFIVKGILESDQFFIFYPHLNLWQEIQTEGHKIPRCAHSSVLLSSKIAVFGGIGNERYLEPDVIFIETDQQQVLSRITKDRMIQNQQIIEEPNKLDYSYRKKKSVFYEDSETSDGYKPFRINLRKTTQVRRSYLPNPQRKQVLIRFDIMIGFIKKVIQDNLHILQNFDKYQERKII